MREAGITLGIIGWVIGLLLGLYVGVVGVLIANEVPHADEYTKVFNVEDQDDEDIWSFIEGKGKLIAVGVITVIVAIVGIVGASLGKRHNLTSVIMTGITAFLGLVLFVLALAFWSYAYPVYLLYLLAFLMVGGGTGLIFAGGMVERNRGG